MREKLLGKLHKGLQNMQLPLWYLSIMVYVGTEPSKLLRNKVSYRVGVAKICPFGTACTIICEFLQHWSQKGHTQVPIFQHDVLSVTYSCSFGR